MSIGQEILAVSQIIDEAASRLGAIFAEWDPALDRDGIEAVARAELWYAADDLGHLFSPSTSRSRDALEVHIDDALETALRDYMNGDA